MNTTPLMTDIEKSKTPARMGAYLTARQMAFRSASLSPDAMTATDAGTGAVWKWSNHFSVWACVQLAPLWSPSAVR